MTAHKPPAKHPSRKGEAKRILSECDGADLSSSARLVALTLWTYTNGDGLCWPGLSTLMNQTGLSPSGLRKALRELESARLVRTARPKGSKRIKVGAVSLSRGQALYLLWPVASAAGKARIDGMVQPAPFDTPARPAARTLPIAS